MVIFRRLENPFVYGLLEAYWEAYEAVELNTYADLQYWKEAWRFHALILEHLDAGRPEAALEAFKEHTTLLRHRTPPEAPPEEAVPPTSAISPAPVNRYAAE
jgi:DNA-binding GntR family transcriptional regulator